MKFNFLFNGHILHSRNTILGFNKYGDGLVMDLSSYGKPSLKEEINELITFDNEKLLHKLKIF